VYVSLYKGLMSISGAVLAGEVDVIQHATLWRQRLGGDVSRNWPMAVLAERGLAELLPRMPGFTERARTLSALLSQIPGLEVVPDPPVTPMFHLHLDAAPEAVMAASAELREVNTLGAPRYVRPSSSPNRCRVEIMVSEHLDEVTDAEIGDLFAEMIRRARA
jgi:threonine aldolase